MSIAASASAEIAPMVVAWVAYSMSRQSASTRSASWPIRRGARWSAMRRITDEPPVPIV